MFDVKRFAALNSGIGSLIEDYAFLYGWVSLLRPARGRLKGFDKIEGKGILGIPSVGCRWYRVSRFHSLSELRRSSRKTLVGAGFDDEALPGRRAEAHPGIPQGISGVSLREL